MKNLKYILTIGAFSAGVFMFAQEKTVNVGLGTESTIKKEKQIQMPEKDDRDAKKWRQDGLKKKKKVQSYKKHDGKLKDGKLKKNKLKKEKVYRKAKNEKVYRNNRLNTNNDFGQYTAWRARNKNNPDKDWTTLENNIQKRINRSDESMKIIRNKRAEIQKDYTFGKITKDEYIRLSNELNRAEKDVKSISNLSSVRRD